jgi:ADP-ribose pyrophosphatase
MARDDDPRSRYEALRKERPGLFANPPGADIAVLLEAADVAQAEAAQQGLLARQGLPPSWGRTGVVYEDPYLIVLRDAVRRPDGSLGTYVRTTPASHADGAAVLPVLDGRIVLLRHFRHATRTWHREIPRGFGEPGVAPAALAVAELREEIGAEVSRLEDLGVFHSNTGTTADHVWLFRAELSSIGEPQLSEGISGIERLVPGDVAAAIAAGEITDSFTMGAFTRAWLRGLLPGLASPGAG